MGLFGKTQVEFAQMNESERLEANQFQLRMIIEMLGKPKEHMESTFGELLKKLSEESDIKITKKTLSKTKKQGELFSRFVEIELWAKNLSAVMTLCFDYMPSSLEIVQPEKTLFRSHELNGFFNDLQAKLHHVDMLAKNVTTEKAIISSNFLKLVENAVVLSLALGPKDVKEISKMIGMQEETLDSHLKSLIEKKRINLEGERYVLA